MSDPNGHKKHCTCPTCEAWDYEMRKFTIVSIGGGVIIFIIWKVIT